MGKLTSVDIILGVLYISAALFLCIVAYMLFIKRFKRSKLEALNAVGLITSQNNNFKQPTKFLITSAEGKRVRIALLDGEEKEVSVLIDQEINQDEYPLEFNPALYDSGKYYLYLTTANASILRSITIE